MIELAQDSYGKSDIRLMKVRRGPERHEIVEMTVDIRLTGDLAAGYTDGDNTRVLPTDTMKNTVYALAKKHPVKSPEQFASLLAEHFVSSQPQIAEARVDISQRLWEHASVGASPHPHAFTGVSCERHTASVVHSDDNTSIRSGIRDLVLLKSKDSGFSDFLEDEYTTLKPTDDRVLATRLSANWLHSGDDVDYAAHHRGVRSTLIDVFANHESLSVQHTMYAMGEKALEEFTGVSEIYLAMPNVHNLVVDLAPFGMDNPHEILKPIDEPSGHIDATLRRER